MPGNSDKEELTTASILCRFDTESLQMGLLQWEVYI